MSLNTNITDYWKLDENTGTTTADAVLGGTPGSWQGTLGSQWGTGLINSGGVFNGTDNYISLPYNNIGGTTMSVSGWFNTNGGSNLHQTIISYMSTILAFSTSGTTQLEWWSDSGSSNITKGVTINTGVWNHFVATQNNTTFTLYYNGTQVRTGIMAALNTANDSSQIGAYLASSNFLMNGKLDEIGVWSRILSGAEVTQLFNAGVGLQYPFPNVVAALGGTLLMMGIG